MAEQVERDAMAEQVATCAHCSRTIVGLQRCSNDGWCKPTPTEPQAGAQPAGETPYTCQTCGCNHVMTIQQYCDAVRTGAMDGFSPAAKDILQAGAQVPSQDASSVALASVKESIYSEWEHRAFSDPRFIWQWMLDRAAASESHLNTIRDYVLAAQQIPITRESILAAPQVAITEEEMIVRKEKLRSEWTDVPGDHDFDWFLIERIARLEAELEARKLTELTLCDEAHGLYNLVLSETK
jgi:hypothetical protein